MSGAALATVTTANLEDVDGIRIMGQDFGGVQSAFDNLLIGTTMGDVAAIPEPSAAALGLLAAGGLFLRRRRN